MGAPIPTIRDIWQKSNQLCLFCKAFSEPLEIVPTYGKLLIERCKLLAPKILSPANNASRFWQATPFHTCKSLPRRDFSLHRSVQDFGIAGLKFHVLEFIYDSSTVYLRVFFCHFKLV